MIELQSPAKINLILQILNKRTDGFHSIYSVMQTVSLYDSISLKLRMRGVTLECDDPSLKCDETNLIIRAVKAFQLNSGINFGIRMYLSKRIPVGGGMGGGSSNAGTILGFLNRHFACPLNNDELLRVAASLGSDVPFFLVKGTAIAEGRGERIRSVPSINALQILLINPGFPVPTAAIYKGLNLSLTTHRDALNIRPASWVDPTWTRFILENITNDLEPTVIQAYPVINEALAFMKRNGAVKAAVSGSGGTVFGVFDCEKLLAETQSKAVNLFPWVRKVETVE